MPSLPPPIPSAAPTTASPVLPKNVGQGAASQVDVRGNVGMSVGYYSGLSVSMLMVSSNSARISFSRGLDFCTMRAAKLRVLPS